MQSIIALAGLVSLATASIAPLGSYDDDFRVSTLVASAPNHTQSAVFRPVATFTSPLQWSTTKFIRTSAFTTFCPEPTTLTFNTRTLTVTAATTLTVTDCYNGCEVVRPLPTTTIEATTTIVKTTQLETFCPEPTTLTFSTRTFTVTQATTLTIPQNITTSSVFKTVVPVQPTKIAPNSTFRAPAPTYYKPAPTHNAPVAPVPTPVAPVPTSAAPVPVAPVPTSAAPVPVAPVPTFDAPDVIEPFIPATETLNAIVPPYPTTVLASTRVWQPTVSNNASFPTQPALYTGSADRVGAGALMAIVGFAALF